VALPEKESQFPGVGPIEECGSQFWGQSFIADPDGSILKQASKTQEEIVICRIDLDLVNEVKKEYSFPYRDRRVDSYSDLLKYYSD